MSQLSQQFESLNKAIDKLETALDTKIDTLTAHLEAAQSQDNEEAGSTADTQALSTGIDSVVGKIEQLIRKIEG